MADFKSWNALRGVHIKAAIGLEKPYSVACLLQRDRSKCPYPGIDVEIFEYIAAILGFSYEYVEPEDEEWGELVNGSWNGIMRLVTTGVLGEVNISATTLIYDKDRATSVNLSYPVLIEQTGYAILTPLDNGISFLISKPFQITVWLTILMSLVINGMIYALLDYLHDSRRGNYTPKLEILRRSYWIIYGESISQAVNIRCDKVWRCVLLTCWRLSVFVLLSTYSGCLISFLMVRWENIPFDNAAQLAQAIDRGQLRFITETEEEIQQLESEEAAFRTAFQNNPAYITADEEHSIQALLSTRHPSYVYMGTIKFLKANLASHCNVTIVPDSVSAGQTSHFAFSDQSSTALKPLFDRTLYDMNDLIASIEKRYATARSQCQQRSVMQQPLALHHIQGQIILFAAGILGSLLAAFMETVQTAAAKSNQLTLSEAL